MKKNYFILIMLILSTILMLSCSDDDNFAKDESLRVSKVYRGDNLAVFLNERELDGRRILFVTKDLQTADLTLIKIIPGEDSLTFSNIVFEAIENTKGDYSFVGHIASDYRTIDLQGQIVNDKMMVNIQHTVESDFVGRWKLPVISIPQNIMLDITPIKEDATIDMQGIMGYGVIPLVSDDYDLNTFVGTLGLFVGMLNLELEFEDNGNMEVAWKPSSLIPLPAGSYSGGIPHYNIDDSTMYLSIALDSLIVDLLPKDILTNGSLNGLDIKKLDIEELLSFAQKAYTGLPIKYAVTVKGKKKTLALHIPKEHLLPILKVAIPLLIPKLEGLDWKSINAQAEGMGMELGLSAKSVGGLLEELVRVMDESPKFDFVLNLQSK